MPAAKFTIRGQVLAPIRSPYASLILPIVALKKFFQLLHRLVVTALWSELIQGKTADQSTTIVVFLILCLLSLVAYYGREISGWGIAFCCLIWVIDCQIARRQFRSQDAVFTSLECRGDWIIWQQADGSAHLKFQLSEIAQISLIRTELRRGAFQEILGTVWQVYLTRCDHSELLLHETSDTLSAFAKATEASYRLALPLIVMGSEGSSSHAAQPVNLQGIMQRTQICTTIVCQKSPQRWHIFCRWQFSSTWRWLGESLSKFGFLLFAVIVAKLMIQFGGLLALGLFAQGMAQESVGFDFNPLTLRWQMWVELAIAGGIMLIKGAQLSREEHLYVTPASLTFCLGSQKIAQIPTPSVSDLLFLTQPFPALLILGEQAIEIRELQHETEFRIMLLQLQAALDNLS